MITLPSGREIGLDRKVFIIAEIGSNWATLDGCLTSIRIAKKVGADAAKFQLFDYESLYGQSQYEKQYGSPYLPTEWLPKLKEECDRASIEFMCTAFSPEGAQEVNKFVNIHKVASSDLTYVELLKTLNAFGKPVFLSTGAGSHTEVNLAINALDECDVVPMYCVPNYPARTVDLRQIPLLYQATGLPCGYSDHSLDVLNIPKKAALHDAVVIEKHANFVDHDGPDAPHSIDDIQFSKMVDSIRFEASWSDPRENRAMVMQHKRRLIATKDLNVGDILTYGQNYGAYRSLKDESHAWSPWHNVNGKVLLKPVKVGEGIGPGDV